MNKTNETIRYCLVPGFKANDFHFSPLWTLTLRFIIDNLYCSMFRCNPYWRKMRPWSLQGVAEEKDFIGDMRESTVRGHLEEFRLSRAMRREREMRGKWERKGREPREEGARQQRSQDWPKWQTFIGIRSWGKGRKGSEGSGLERFRVRGMEQRGATGAGESSCQRVLGMLRGTSASVSHFSWVYLGPDTYIHSFIGVFVMEVLRFQYNMSPCKFHVMIS